MESEALLQCLARRGEELCGKTHTNTVREAKATEEDDRISLHRWVSQRTARGFRGIRIRKSPALLQPWSKSQHMENVARFEQKWECQANVKICEVVPLRITLEMQYRRRAFELAIWKAVQGRITGEKHCTSPQTDTQTQISVETFSGFEEVGRSKLCGANRFKAC